MVRSVSCVLHLGGLVLAVACNVVALYKLARATHRGSTTAARGRQDILRNAHMGMDIGGTLIGMHLRCVAVPVRIEQNTIGAASILCARTRPKYVGGSRAVYPEGAGR